MAILQREEGGKGIEVISIVSGVKYLDPQNADQFVAEVRLLLESLSEESRAVFDLTTVDLTHGNALMGITLVAAATKKKRLMVRVCADPNSQLMHRIKVTYLDRILDVRHTRDRALAELRGG